MVSARLDSLIRDRIERTYLAGDDGFWADLVLQECVFLEDRGYALDKISFHQQGDYIGYGGPRGLVRFEFSPDADWIGASAKLDGGFLSFEGTLDLLALIHAPAAEPPPKMPVTRDVIKQNVRFWADALRSADDML